MRGYKTSLFGMFQESGEGLERAMRIEIPLIQRDYAQGRQNTAVQVIRNDFLEVLVAAIVGAERVDLDFVYGEVTNGTLRPLDGQQRLTTLFLFHWYLAARTGRLEEAARWLKFTYATRPTAELFCRELMKANYQPSAREPVPSAWITDQSWYLFAWRHDPTIQSMLVVLDAIHERLESTPFSLDSMWMRLTDTENPAVSFYFLPIEDLPSGEELYIKMNSRGKPLTEFENFKARLEGIMADALSPARFSELIHKLDGAWADVLWPFHGGDYIVDDEFMRYLTFIIEICEWRDGGGGGGRLLDRAERAFSRTNANAQRNVDFLFHAFDTWIATDIGGVFESHFTHASGSNPPGTERVILFESRNVNLFQECCRRYGEMNRNARLFSLSETLLMFAMLIHRQHSTDDIRIRLRTLRNLTDTAEEVREIRMVDLVQSVEQLIRYGTIDDLKGFNADRVADERRKLDFVAKNPDFTSVVHELEDHPLLRGRVFAFDLDREHLERRSSAFAIVARPENWNRLTAALLAMGNYGFPIGKGAFQFGTGNPNQELRWREVFTRNGRGKNDKLSNALADLLDVVSTRDSDPSSTLEWVASAFAQARANAGVFDWRYYLVAYESMRAGDTGVYYGEHLPRTGEWDYSMCMLRTNSITGGAWYRDPFLLAVWRESGADAAVRDLWFSGYPSEPRWLRLSISGAGIRCVSAGFELEPPLEPEAAHVFQLVCEQHGCSDSSLLPVQQADHEGHLIDTEDRVQKAASFLKSLVNAGL